MRILKLSLAALGLVSLMAAGRVEAQVGGGTGTFKWYIGGQGGIMSFRSPVTGREFVPMGGGHLLITAKRTGLLLSVDQGFGPTQGTSTFFIVRDSTGAVSSSGSELWSFRGMRRYSASLIGYPIRNQNIQPYIGVGVGIAHTTSNSPGLFADGNIESGLSSTAFGSALAGLEFRVGPFSAFGQFQVATKQGYKQVDNVLLRDKSGKPLITRSDFGEWTLGANHVLSGGLRFSLGNARERATSGGY
jgi:hypothetical protein